MTELNQLFIGVDEAGYGPNLGPLVVAASVWQAPGGMTEAEFLAALQDDFRPQPWKAQCPHVPLGDSKLLYQSGGGLASLEAGLLALLSHLHDQVHSVKDLLDAVQPNHGDMLDHLPWYDGLENFSVPKSNELDTEVERLAAIARGALSHQSIRLVGLRATVITETFFNGRVQQLRSKGQLLSQASLRLVAELLESQAGQPAFVYCDRQGGRKNYLPVLLDALPERWFEQTQVSSQRCSYRSAGPPACEIHFTVQGDRFPPTALASMLAKYLRERLMESFNTFWCARVPALRPTAGYPLDAKRFRAEIDRTASQVGLPPERWWRSR